MTKPLSYLNDILCIESATFDVQRNDELSGTGDGRVWQAELAPPLWTCTFNIAPNSYDEIKQIAARIRALGGSKEPFLLTDPTSKQPQSDPNRIHEAITPIINSIPANGSTISMSGIPQGLKLTYGDKLSIQYGSNNDKYSYHEVCGEVTANASGHIINLPVFPFIPSTVIVNMPVALYDAPCKMVIYPDTFNSGTSQARNTSGLTFKAIQKR